MKKLIGLVLLVAFAIGLFGSVASCHDGNVFSSFENSVVKIAYKTTIYDQLTGKRVGASGVSGSGTVIGYIGNTVTIATVNHLVDIKDLKDFCAWFVRDAYGVKYPAFDTSVYIQYLNGDIVKLSVKKISVIRNSQYDSAKLMYSDLTPRHAVSMVISGMVAGNDIYAIGNPLGIEFVYRYGVASNMRSFDGIKTWVFDMNVSPGDSGMGIFDSNGNLVAVFNAVFLGGTGHNVAMAVHLNAFNEKYMTPYIY